MTKKHLKEHELVEAPFDEGIRICENKMRNLQEQLQLAICNFI